MLFGRTVQWNDPISSWICIRCTVTILTYSCLANISVRIISVNINPIVIAIRVHNSCVLYVVSIWFSIAPQVERNVIQFGVDPYTLRKTKMVICICILCYYIADSFVMLNPVGLWSDLWFVDQDNLIFVGPFTIAKFEESQIWWKLRTLSLNDLWNPHKPSL